MSNMLVNCKTLLIGLTYLCFDFLLKSREATCQQRQKKSTKALTIYLNTNHMANSTDY